MHNLIIIAVPALLVKHTLIFYTFLASRCLNSMLRKIKNGKLKTCWTLYYIFLLKSYRKEQVLKILF